MFCKKCGYQIPDDSEFCSKCGAKQDNVQSELLVGVEKSNSDLKDQINVKGEQEKKTGCMVRTLQIIGGIIVIALVGSCIFGGSGDKGSKTGTNGQKQENKSVVYNYTCDVSGVGKVKGLTRSNVGVAIAKINKMQTIDGSYSSTQAQGIFNVIYVVVTNHQKDAVTIDANSFKLIDDKGREFSYSVEGDTALEMSNRKTLFLKKINPGITIAGYVAYDVPKDANITDLTFRGGFSGDKGQLPFKVMLE